MRTSLFLLTLFVGSVACTTDPDDPIATGGEGAFFTRSGGNFDKLPLTPIDGAGKLEGEAALGIETTVSGAKSRFTAFVEDKNTVCGTGAQRGGATIFSIEALSPNPTFTAGTFTLSQQGLGPNQVRVKMVKLQEGCGPTSQTFDAESGTVSIAQVTATFVAGTFNVTFPNGAGTLAGSFNVPLCPSLDYATCVR